MPQTSRNTKITRFGRSPTRSDELATKQYVDDSGTATLTTKGDILSFSNILVRLGVGSNGQVLTADSAQGVGLEWAAAAGGTEDTELEINGSTFKLGQWMLM